jgi:hypothetical protein
VSYREVSGDFEKKQYSQERVTRREFSIHVHTTLVCGVCGVCGGWFARKNVHDDQAFVASANRLDYLPEYVAKNVIKLTLATQMACHLS